MRYQGQGYADSPKPRTTQKPQRSEQSIRKALKKAAEAKHGNSGERGDVREFKKPFAWSDGILRDANGKRVPCGTQFDVGEREKPKKEWWQK